ncbi:MAG: ComF family protein [Candidatus Kerfeldbacteria bacterium]|nr:ComF family protein [Candidatus Kerfeldbacteria bacterium]
MFASISTLALDLLFPPSCRICGQEDAWLCAPCLAPLKPRRTPQPVARVDQLLTLGSYDIPVLKRIIQELKYNGGQVLAEPIGQTLATAFGRELTDNAVVPVPLHPKRQRNRGFNQSTLIARSLAKRLNLMFIEAVDRIRHTQPQVELAEDERLTNVRAAFRLKPGLGQLPKNGIIVDDVFTTGATSSEVAAVLRSAGMKHITVLTIAKG